MAAKHVNLLDISSAGPSQTELNYLSIVIVSAVVIVGCLGFEFWQRHNLKLAQGQLETVTTEVTKLNESIGSKTKKGSNQDILSKLNHPIFWSNLLKEVTHVIPPAIQLSQITGALTNNRSLVVMGSSSGLPAIFALKNSLLDIPECSQVSVTNLNRSTFQIECQIR